MKPSKNLDDLIALMAKLRAECPWDKKQTSQSLIPYAIEETYELVEAIYSKDLIDIKAELGDVLLQVVFHACIYSEGVDKASIESLNALERFDMGDVIYTLMEKLIRRHPHVFEKNQLSKQGVMDEQAVAKRWQEIKAEEYQQAEQRGKKRRRLDVVKAGSALMQAQNLQKKASDIGFDWVDVVGARNKLTEELAELDHAIDSHDIHAIQDELGDCFFSLVNVARKLDVDGEVALLGTINKFKKRFAYIEDELSKKGKTLEASSLTEMDKLWEDAKNQN